MSFRRIRDLPAVACLALFAGCATANGDGADGGAQSGDGGAPDADVSGPDAAPACSTQPCDLVEQCGCSGAEVCDLDGNDLPNTACRSVASPGMEEANCSSPTDCAGGYVCIPQNNGQCRRYCENHEDCGADQYCRIQLTADGEPIGADVCTKSCTPQDAANNGCPGDPQYACDFFFYDPDEQQQNDEVWITDCRREVSSNTDEADCSDGQLCASGYTCITFSDPDTGDVLREVCKQICSLEAADDGCQVGSCQELTANDPQPNPNGETLGICN